MILVALPWSAERIGRLSRTSIAKSRCKANEGSERVTDRGLLMPSRICAAPCGIIAFLEHDTDLLRTLACFEGRKSLN